MGRLKELRTMLGLSQKQLADVLGIKQNSYSYIENGKASITDRNKKRLYDILGVNPDWLEGDDDASVTLIPKDVMKSIIGSGNGKKALTKEIADIISDVVKQQTRPRIPYTASAGSLTSAVEGVTESECEQIPVITAFPSYDFTMFVKGDSMYPNYEGGDEVACKRIDSTSFIQWGKVHVLDTAQGIVIKRVYDDDGNVKCVSYNKEYPDFTISKEEVYSMSLVVGMIRL